MPALGGGTGACASDLITVALTAGESDRPCAPAGTGARLLSAGCQGHLDGHGEARGALRGLADHGADELRPAEERRADALLHGPLLRAAAVEVDAVGAVRDELRGGAELLVGVRRELDDQRPESEAERVNLSC